MQLIEHFHYMASQKIVYFTMPWNRLLFAGFGVPVEIMLIPVPNEYTSRVF